MAGDWLKVEKRTARKPEIMAIAGILGITRQEALGWCIEFWDWADDNLHDGICHTNVTRMSLNNMLGCAQLADALVAVGWLIETDTGLRIPNFDRHMGESAKKRAEAARRQRLSRQLKSENGHTSVTEKCDQRREEKSIKNPLTPLERGNHNFKTRKTKRPPKVDPLEETIAEHKAMHQEKSK